jgi:hypothetical protein
MSKFKGRKERLYCSTVCKYSSVDYLEKQKFSQLGTSRGTGFREKMQSITAGSKNGMYGKNHSEETKEKMRKKLEGKVPWNKGKLLSPEAEKKKKKFRFKVRNNMARLMNCAEVRGYLENMFSDGMSWDNYGFRKGQWSVDHIRPVSSFDHLTSTVKDINALSNLRPMWSVDNNKKHKKWE